MSRKLIICLLIAVCFWLRSVQAVEVRVVSQTVGTDEMLLAVAAPGQIAALSHLARDPVFSGVSREAAKYPSIGFGDAETILRFRPTLVLFSDYSRAELVEQVRRAGVQVIIFDRYQTLDDVYANLRQIAGALGNDAARRRANLVIAESRARVADLNRRLKGVKPVRVIAPSTYGVIAGADTTFQDICDQAGAENLAVTMGHLTGHAAPPSEAMLKWPVDMLVMGGTNHDAAMEPFLKLPPYAFMKAVHDRRAVLIDVWALGCVSHLRIRAYEQLARRLHPDRFQTD